MTEHPRIAQRRLAAAGDKLGQWLEEAGTEWDALSGYVSWASSRSTRSACPVAPTSV